MRGIIPLYIFPHPEAWKPLIEVASSKQSPKFNVIINPSNGPGSSTDPLDPDYVTAISTLNAYPSVQTLGYVALGYGSRPQEEIRKDITTYAGWANHQDADIHMDGIFFDEAPSGAPWLSFVEQLAGHAKTTFSNRIAVVLNPGVVIEERFYTLVDEVVVFENTYSEFNLESLTEEIPRKLRSKSSIIIKEFLGDEKLQQSILGEMSSAFFGGAFVTNQSGYDKWSDEWISYCEHLKVGGTRYLKERFQWIKFLG